MMKKITAIIIAGVLLPGIISVSSLALGDGKIPVGRSCKYFGEGNPISSQVFCADPTAVEYNGRLYVYGTSDRQQCDIKGPDADNTYEMIKSIEVFSTDDMVNWEYHGAINVGEIAPWIANSWAPSVVSRAEEDGLTHFYLYFSNNGTGCGVITATDPLGPWSDPLGRPLIRSDTPGLTDCPNPFDPGAVIDGDGVGWLSFGGGRAGNGTEYMPGSARIVRLGPDMLSFDSEFVVIPAPYFFEASELNYINGTWIYTYCSDWSDHGSRWEYGTPAPGGCAMIWMKTNTPLDPESWEMGGECLKNPGEFGFDYSNNHTHLQKFMGRWYIFYHTLVLRKAMGIRGGYRSICVDEIRVDEEAAVIEGGKGTRQGVTVPPRTVSPYVPHPGAQIAAGADISYDVDDMRAPLAVSNGKGAWTSFLRADFSAEGRPEKAVFSARVQGPGEVEVRLDSPTGRLIARVSAERGEAPIPHWIAAVHDLYFVFGEKGASVVTWEIIGDLSDP